MHRHPTPLAQQPVPTMTLRHCCTNVTGGQCWSKCISTTTFNHYFTTFIRVHCYTTVCSKNYLSSHFWATVSPNNELDFNVAGNVAGRNWRAHVGSFAKATAKSAKRLALAKRELGLIILSLDSICSDTGFLIWIKRSKYISGNE